MRRTVEFTRNLLTAADLFFDPEDELPPQTLNLNDAMHYSTADGQHVADEELPELARLFWLYGACGVLYWVSEKRGGERASNPSVQRKIDFVRESEVKG